MNPESTQCEPCQTIIEQIDGDRPVNVPLDPVMASTIDKYSLMGMIALCWLAAGLLINSALPTGWWQYVILYLCVCGGFYNAMICDCHYLDIDEEAQS